MLRGQTPGGRLSRRALLAELGSSGVALLLVAAAGCQSAYPTPAPSSAPTQAPQPTPATAPTPSPASAQPTASVAPKPAVSPPAQPATAPSAAASTPAPIATVTTASSPTAAPRAASPTAGPAAKVSGVADLAVVRGPSPADITRAAVEAIGGIGRFVPKGSAVVLKPNICTAASPEYAVCTNPEVMETLVKLCKEAGASKVKVLDYGWGSAWNVSYAVSGIDAAVKRAGGEMVPITPIKWKRTDIPKAKVAKSVEVFEDVLTADVVINVPIAKQHGLSGLTLAMKNLMGVIRNREPFHLQMGQSLSDLALVVKPAFTLLDAVRILVRNGPGGGSLDDVKRLDTVVASTDMVAVDAYASTLFGFRTDYLETVLTGEKNGLGTADLTKLKIAEVKR